MSRKNRGNRTGGHHNATHNHNKHHKAPQGRPQNPCYRCGNPYFRGHQCNPVLVVNKTKDATAKTNNDKKKEYCNFCKEHTDHVTAGCPGLEEWPKKMEGDMIRGFNQLPYCIVCGDSQHNWNTCQPVSALERRKREFMAQAERILFKWVLASNAAAALTFGRATFCGFCGEFGTHNTLNCTTSAAEYRQDEQLFLLSRFDIKPDDDSSRKERRHMPLIEKKCRKCRTVLPKIAKLDGQPDHGVIVDCVNTSCKHPNILHAEWDNESNTFKDNNTWRSPTINRGGTGCTNHEHTTDCLADYEKALWPHLRNFNVTILPNEQPYYNGPQVVTRRAKDLQGTNTYENDGWWSFNAPGNFQPFFPPLSIPFSEEDKYVSQEPELPINHTRAGLIPFCRGCGLFGAVFDNIHDVVMAQTGPSDEGNFAGAGKGDVQFENPLYRLGGRNAAGESQYIPKSRCQCTITNGAAPQLGWVTDRP